MHFFHSEKEKEKKFPSLDFVIPWFTMWTDLKVPGQLIQYFFFLFKFIDPLLIVVNLNCENIKELQNYITVKHEK